MNTFILVLILFILFWCILFDYEVRMIEKVLDEEIANACRAKEKYLA